jgi:hypothetical protein
LGVARNPILLTAGEHRFRCQRCGAVLRERRQPLLNIVAWLPLATYLLLQRYADLVWLSEHKFAWILLTLLLGLWIKVESVSLEPAGRQIKS